MAELRDVKIKFISLVKKAANKKVFAIIKSVDGEYEVESSIIKADDEQRLVTSIVYEPFVKDAQDDFMTPPEIQKAAHYFMMHGQGVDVQHDYKKADANVVESWVTKNDEVIEGQQIKKGTWLATTKVNDDALWSAIKKGIITGFSMGGTGLKIDKEDTMTPEEIKKAIAEALGDIKKSKEEGVAQEKLDKALETVKELENKVTELEKSEDLKTAKTKIDELEKSLKKMDEILKSNSAPTTGNSTQTDINKAEEEYSEIIRKANLSTGASLVPKQLSNQMQSDMKEIAPFFADGNKISATGTTVRVPVRKPNTTTSAKGKEEGKPTAAGDTNFTEVEISKGVIQSVIPITDELRKDSQFNVAALVREYGTEDIAEIIAQNTFNGVSSTTNKIEGFTKDTVFATRSVAVTANGSLTIDDLLNVRKEVKPQYWSGSKYYVSKDAYFQMKTIKDTTGRPLWQESQITGTPSTYDGYPVVLCWQMDDTFPVMFGNFKKLYMYFVDYQMESEIDRKAVDGFTNEILRARMGGKVVNTEAAYMLKKKAGS